MAHIQPTSSFEEKPELTHHEGSLPSLGKDLEGSHGVDPAEDARIMYVHSHLPRGPA